MTFTFVGSLTFYEISTLYDEITIRHNNFFKIYYYLYEQEEEVRSFYY